MAEKRTIVTAGALLLGMLTASGASAQTASVKPLVKKPSAVVRPAVATRTRSDESGQVAFSLAYQDGRAYLKAEANGIRVERTNTESGVSVRVEANGDVLEFAMERDGRSAISRKGRVRRFGAGVSKPEHVQAVQTLTAGSAAMQAFDAIVAVLEDSERPEAVSLLATYALVSGMHGNHAPARLLARKVRKLAERGNRAASTRVGEEAGPRECWNEYERSVYEYAVQYESCYWNYWWNPIYISACNATWIMKVELAFFWVISCSGGVPVS